jgi:predicted DNA-binding antitoxin AbrB/MazE fold protein
MISVEAIFRGGVLEPLGKVDLPEGQHVRLTILPNPIMDPDAWMKRVDAFQEQVFQRRGGVPFPDSTQMIAEDRMRDV